MLGKCLKLLASLLGQELITEVAAERGRKCPVCNIGYLSRVAVPAKPET